MVDADEWDDILGTGSILKKLEVPGEREAGEVDSESPRKFFALIDVDTRLDGHIIETECHRAFLLDTDADLFPGIHIVIPLMQIGEKSTFLFDSRFCYGIMGNLPFIPPHARLECSITLYIRVPYDEFLSRMTVDEKLRLGTRKKQRGRFWYSRGDFEHAITIYQSISRLCILDDDDGEEPVDMSDAGRVM